MKPPNQKSPARVSRSIFLTGLVFVLGLFLTAGLALAEQTNYYCIVCGKGPLTGRIWMSKWGTVCDDCYHLENHCSICGIPVTKDYVKTGDGRFICKFDKVNAVLDVDEAKEVFSDVRRELVELFGSSYVLQYPDVTVSLFDVDYWSEKGRDDGLHKYGFASTRKTPSGACTHEVVMLSGRLRMELSATAAHEYTHLWINENCAASHIIDSDTVEGICELCAYKLMESRSQPDEMKRILANPYTHGAIKKLVALEQDKGMPYILDWVKNGTSATPDTESAALVAPMRVPRFTFTNVPPPLPEHLKLNGLLLDGQARQAIIDGVSFTEGETKEVKLRNGTVQVHCTSITQAGTLLQVAGQAGTISLKIGEESPAP